MNHRQSRLLCAVGTSLLLLGSRPAVAGPRRITAQSIFSRSRNAVVQVLTPSGSGTGFIVSSDGLIATANHVVTSRLLAGNQITVQYMANIRVVLPDGRVLEAEPAVPSPPPSEWASHDYALLRIRDKNLPHLDLGSWSDVEVGDQLTVVGFAFTPPTLVSITATVSGRNAIQNPTGVPSLVDAIIFEGPINRGLSGSPLISNRSGRVVGIVSTKLAGLPLDLYSLRDKISMSNRENAPQEASWARDQAILEVINVLDQSLVSGMGGGVAIDYVSDAMATMVGQQALAPKH